MKAFSKGLLIQMGIFVLYTLIAVIFEGNDGLIFSFFASLVHFVVALILGIVFLAVASGDEHKKMLGLGFLLSSFLILIIGFAACLVSLNGAFI